MVGRNRQRADVIAHGELEFRFERLARDYACHRKNANQTASRPFALRQRNPQTIPVGLHSAWMIECGQDAPSIDGGDVPDVPVRSVWVDSQQQRSSWLHVIPPRRYIIFAGLDFQSLSVRLRRLPVDAQRRELDCCARQVVSQ